MSAIVVRTWEETSIRIYLRQDTLCPIQLIPSHNDLLSLVQLLQSFNLRLDIRFSQVSRCPISVDTDGTVSNACDASICVDADTAFKCFVTAYSYA